MADEYTPNLDMLLMVTGAPNREILHNNLSWIVDTITSSVLTLDVSGSGDYTLTDGITGEAKAGCLRLTGVLTGARTLIVPAKGRQYLVSNGTTGSQTLTLTTADGGGVTVEEGAWALLVCDGTDVLATLTGGSGSGPLPTASETQAGIVELATAAETLTGTDTTRAVHPAGLQAKVDALPGAVPATDTQAGVIELATSAEVLTGTDTTRGVTPATLQAKVNALPQATTTAMGLIELATASEVTTGTDAQRAVTPATLASRQATETLTGLVELATTAEVTAGTDDVRTVTPLKLAQRLTAVAPPAASDTVAGLVELATPAETTTGTDATRAVTPAGLAAKVPGGTPLSVPRYAASGTALEGTTVTSDASGQLGIGTATPFSTLHVANGFLTVDRYAASPVLLGRAAGGTLGSPSATAANDTLLLLGGRGHDGTGFTAAQRGGLYLNAAEAFTSTTQGTYLLAYTTRPGTVALSAKLRVDGLGNLSLGSNVALTAQQPGAGAEVALVLNRGVAPTTSPADAVQLWSTDRASTAGKASLHVRTEDGTSHVLGDQSGIGTLCDATLGSGASYQALNVKGSTLYVAQSSVQERAVAALTATLPVPTDATRTGRLTVSAYDAVGAREGLRVEADGTAARLSFYGASAVAKPTVSGSRGGNAALASVLAALANLGLMTDSSSA